MYITICKKGLPHCWFVLVINDVWVVAEATAHFCLLISKKIELNEKNG